MTITSLPNALEATLLTEARNLYEACPAQSGYAFDRDGSPVAPDAPEAVSFCAEGAVLHSAAVLGVSDDVREAALGSLFRASKNLYGLSVIGVNDYGPKAAAVPRVVEAFDKAIKGGQ